MNIMRIGLVALGAAFALAATDAFAQNAQQQVENDVSATTKNIDRQTSGYHAIAIELNPLPLYFGRLSANLEYMPLQHHAIVLNPQITHVSNELAVSGGANASQTFSGFGGEVGYRYYTGHKGIDGVFVGPSLIMGVYNAGLPDGNQAFTTMGVAVDAGVKAVVWDHVAVGAGAGLQWVKVSHDFNDLPTRSELAVGNGVKPRILAEVGYAF